MNPQQTKTQKKLKKKTQKNSKKINNLTQQLSRLTTSKNGTGARRIVNMSKQVSRLGRMNLKSHARNAAAYQHSYARAIVVPEHARNAKIPAIFPQPTSSIHKHLTVPITTNASGKAAIIWNPFFLHDNSVTTSWLLVNNAAGLNLNTPEVTTGYTVQAFNCGIPADTIQSYRLVSAAITIIPQMSRIDAKGKIAGGIVNYDHQNASGFTSGTNQFPFAGELTVASNIDNLLYFNTANVTDLQSIRHIYFPFDPTYESYTPLNKSHADIAPTDFFFAYYITGAPANANFNLEIYYNMETIPTPYAQSYMSMENYAGNENSNTIIKSLAGDSILTSQAGDNIPSLLSALDEMEGGVKPAIKNDWLDRSIDLITTYGPPIMKSLSAFI